MMRPRWYRSVPALPCLALACAVLGCQADEPGKPMPPVEVITGAEFVDGPEIQEMTARRVRIPGDRVVELRRLFDGSRIDPDPARWAEKGKLKLFLKGGGTEVYDIYWTGKARAPMPIIFVATSVVARTPRSTNFSLTSSKQNRPNRQIGRAGLPG